ncbi:DUF4406 domain-containing protein [Methylomonas sp. EFPC3]|uniref:DUF4406 domain-containing protein n=1 Tax=Methylomonas TaxID=416 RepID=UPI00112A66CE|nr:MULTISPECIES: DUF4406 domain-containing protein [Methylomonas]TPQ28972.1 hypothetical protein C2U68_03165 [Methylomonas koyamae]WFP51396.1 DUF4406 domain-containing protein [Methylomonas sp. EFPC3]
MTRIYLAGPMSGIADFNYPLFNATAEKLRAKGYHVENPAENPVPEGNSWREYMRLSIRQMLTCDMAVFLPNWEQSRGAQLEHEVATQLSMPIRMVGDLLAEDA